MAFDVHEKGLTDIYCIDEIFRVCDAGNAFSVGYHDSNADF